jgi:hypothetical protein
MYCGRAPMQAQTALLYQWPAGSDLAVCVDSSITDAEAVDRIKAGINLWPTVCGIRLHWTTNADLAYVLIVPAHLPISTYSKELGLTDEPVPGATRQLLMRVNYDEAWTPEELYQTSLHEFGHAVGIGHAPDGVMSCMSAYLDPSVTTPQPWEIGQAQLRYGPPASQPPVGTASFTVSIPEPGDYRITVTGTASGVELTKV